MVANKSFVSILDCSVRAYRSTPAGVIAVGQEHVPFALRLHPPDAFINLQRFFFFFIFWDIRARG